MRKMPLGDIPRSFLGVNCFRETEYIIGVSGHTAQLFVRLNMRVIFKFGKSGGLVI